jgi:hypothetical protein
MGESFDSHPFAFSRNVIVLSKMAVKQLGSCFTAFNVMDIKF